MIKLSIILALVCYEMFAQSFKLNDLAFLDQGSNPFTIANGFFPLGTDGSGLPFDISCTVTGSWTYGYYTTNGGQTNLYLPTYGGMGQSGNCNNPTPCYASANGAHGNFVYGGLLLQLRLISCTLSNSIIITGAGTTIYNDTYYTNSQLSSKIGAPSFSKNPNDNKLHVIFTSGTWGCFTNKSPSSSNSVVFESNYLTTNAPANPIHGSSYSSTTNGASVSGSLPTPSFYFSL